MVILQTGHLVFHFLIDLYLNNKSSEGEGSAKYAKPESAIMKKNHNINNFFLPSPIDSNNIKPIIAKHKNKLKIDRLKIISSIYF